MAEEQEQQLCAHEEEEDLHHHGLEEEGEHAAAGGAVGIGAGARGFAAGGGADASRAAEPSYLSRDERAKEGTSARPGGRRANSVIS